MSDDLQIKALRREIDAWTNRALRAESHLRDAVAAHEASLATERKQTIERCCAVVLADLSSDLGPDVVAAIRSGVAMIAGQPHAQTEK